MRNQGKKNESTHSSSTDEKRKEPHPAQQGREKNSIQDLPELSTGSHAARQEELPEKETRGGKSQAREKGGGGGGDAGRGKIMAGIGNSSSHSYKVCGGGGKNHHCDGQ